MYRGPTEEGAVHAEEVGVDEAEVVLEVHVEVAVQRRDQQVVDGHRRRRRRVVVPAEIPVLGGAGRALSGAAAGDFAEQVRVTVNNERKGKERK